MSLVSQFRFRKVVGNDVSIHWRSTICGNVYVGDHTNINGPCYLSGNVAIGKWCAIAHELRVRSSNHAVEYPNMQAKLNVRYGFVDVHGVEKGAVYVGNACWLGDRVTVLSGVNIGDGAIIGAGAVVTKDVPPFSIAVGNPARVIKQRFEDEVIEALLEIEWWHWSDARIGRNKLFFETNLTELKSENDVHALIFD